MSQWYSMSQIMLYTHAPRQESGGSVLNIPLLVKEKDPNGSCLPHPSHRQSVPPLPRAHDGEIWVVGSGSSYFQFSPHAYLCKGQKAAVAALTDSSNLVPRV